MDRPNNAASSRQPPSVEREHLASSPGVGSKHNERGKFRSDENAETEIDIGWDTIGPCYKTRLRRNSSTFGRSGAVPSRNDRISDNQQVHFCPRKQSNASCGLQTTGSFSLNDVFSTIGISVRERKLSISR